jgi:PilZ domain
VSTMEWNAGEERRGEERRQAPRIDLLVELKGYIITLGDAATILQLSLRGMTVQTTVRLALNQTHDFRLNLDTGPLDVRTRVVHSRFVVEGDDVSYVSGLAFVELTPAATATLEALITTLSAA